MGSRDGDRGRGAHENLVRARMQAIRAKNGRGERPRDVRRFERFHAKGLF